MPTFPWNLTGGYDGAAELVLLRLLILTVPQLQLRPV